MALRTHLLNGTVSLVVSVAATAYTADDESWGLGEVLLAVAVSSFLSGFFTSYFAE